jgi:hypothetical protein
MQTIDLRSPWEKNESLDQVVNSGADHSGEKESITGKFTQRPKP